MSHILPYLTGRLRISSLFNARVHLRVPWFGYLVLAACVAGFLLRVTGINFGLPLHLHPDEASQVENARKVLQGQLNPGFFRYPSFMIYQLAVIYGIAGTVASWLSGGLSQSDYYLIARLLSATYGALTIWAVYLLGTVVLNRWSGLVAGVLMAISPAHIRDSHYATVDVAMVFWSVLAFALLIRAIDTGGWKRLSLAALAAGLSLSTKYTAVYILPALFGLIGWAVWTSARREWQLTTRIITRTLFIVFGIALVAICLFLPKSSVIETLRGWTTDNIIEKEYLGLLDTVVMLCGIGGAALILLGILPSRVRFVERVRTSVLDRRLQIFSVIIIGTFLATSPFVLLDLPHSTRDILYEFRHVSIGAAAHFRQDDPIVRSFKHKEVFPEPAYYWDWWLQQHGWILSVLVLAGAAVLFRENRRVCAASGLVVFLMLLSLTAAGNKADRYGLLLLPFLYLFAGIALGAIRSLRSEPIKLAFTAAVFVAACVIPVQSTLGMLRRDFILPETSEVAYHWLVEHAETGAVIVREAYTPDIETVPAPFRVRSTVGAFDSLSLAQWQNAGARYFMIGRMRSWYQGNAQFYPFQADNYARLEKWGRLVQEFTPSEHVSGEPIWIYTLGPERQGGGR